MPITITVESTPETIQRVAQLVRGQDPAAAVAAAAASVPETPRMCPLCKQPYFSSEAGKHPLVPQEICSLCARAGHQIEERFTVAAKSHWQDFRDAFQQMIRDRRSGAELPTFYQGLNG